VKLNLGEAANTERAEAVFVLQASELALDGGAATVEIAEPLALARDQRVKLSVGRSRFGL
jgi:hypothetical protein